jgi:hypothetical protein
MIQTSCSELLVDTGIHDPKEAFEKITNLMKVCGWESAPKITEKLLATLKHQNEPQYFDEKDEKAPEILIFDKVGNRCWLCYGENGYISSLGYRFETNCNHGDSRCYPIFKEAIDRLGGELISCDGGSTDWYEKWDRGEKLDD